VSRAAAALALFSFLSAPSPSAAQTDRELSGAPAGAELGRAAEALRAHVLASLEGSAGGAVVVRPRATLPTDAPRPFDLASALLAPSLEALGADGRFDVVHVATFAGDGDEAMERASRLGYAILVDVDVRVTGSYLSLSGASHDARAARDARFESRHRLDVSLRRFVGFPPRVSEDTVVARAARMPSSGYLALSVYDLDGDGRSEIVAITASGAELLRLGASRVGSRVDAVGAVAWPSDVGRAPTAPRRTLATARVVDGAVVARLADLAAPIRIAVDEGRLVATRAAGPCPDETFPIALGCGRLVDGRDFFDDVVTRGGEPHQAPAHFYAYAAGDFETPTADAVGVEVAVTPGGRISARVSQTPPGALPGTARAVGANGYGTALAMSDLDLDGAPELLVSSASAEGAGDQLSMLRALPRGVVHVVWRSEPIAGPIWIAAAGDVDGDGLDELLAIEEPLDPGTRSATLWIVR
jgi:hypothetical protein